MLLYHSSISVTLLHNVCVRACMYNNMGNPQSHKFSISGSEKSITNAGIQQQTVVLAVTIDFTKRHCNTNQYVGLNCLFLLLCGVHQYCNKENSMLLCKTHTRHCTQYLADLSPRFGHEIGPLSSFSTRLSSWVFYCQENCRSYSTYTSFKN